MFGMLFQPYHVYCHLMLTRYMHVHLLLLFYIFIGSLFDDPGFAVQIFDVFFYWSGVRWDRTCREELESLSSWLSVFLLFYSCYFLILSISYPVAFTFFYSSVIMCGIIFIIAVTLLLLLLIYITCLSQFRLSVYT